MIFINPFSVLFKEDLVFLVPAGSLRNRAMILGLLPSPAALEPSIADLRTGMPGTWPRLKPVPCLSSLLCLRYCPEVSLSVLLPPVGKITGLAQETKGSDPGGKTGLIRGTIREACPGS